MIAEDDRPQDLRVETCPDFSILRRVVGVARGTNLTAMSLPPWLGTEELALHTEDGGHATAYTERAEQHTINARASRADGYDRSGILDEIRLAQQDLCESVTAQAAVELAAPTSSTVVCDWLLRFHGELIGRYPGNTHVVPFSEHLREYVRHCCIEAKGVLAGHQAERQDPSGVLANPAEPNICRPLAWLWACG